MLCDSIPRDKVATADRLLAQFGLPYRLRAWIDDIDFDVDAALDQVDTLFTAHDVLKEGRPEDCAALFAAMGHPWTGGASDQACDDIECQRSFWDQVADFLLWLAEQIVQLLDYVVDFLRIVVAWITWIAIALALVALAIVVIATLCSMGPGIITAVVEGPAFAVLGALLLIGTAVSILLALLNKLFDWLETVIRDARGRICGKGLPSLPDWDPTGWEPPLWPA
jgi:hypothetical protein